MMKTNKLSLIILVIAICFSACQSEKLADDINTTTKNPSTIPTSVTSDETIDYLNSTEGTMELKNDAGGGEITTRKYRVRYYTVPYQFIMLVGVEKYQQWTEQYNTENADNTNEMVTKKFIEYFDISREDFERANLELAKVLTDNSDNKVVINPKDYADQEVDEIYNVDIIYTFNDEIINKYYLSPDYNYGMKIEFEQAIASGEYTPRTEEWVDIEAMEAEIIAKYGEAEIVTEQEITTTEVETTIPKTEILLTE